MFVLGNLLLAIAKVMDIILTFMYWLILIRALVSWVNPDPFNPIVQFLYKATEPVLENLRRILPANLRFGIIDFSPLIAVIIIYFLKTFIVKTLLDISLRLS